MNSPANPPAPEAAPENPAEERYPPNFISHLISDDIANGVNQGRVHTRFPPEPNGYLHIGHAKAICLNFGIARDFGGRTNLRFDDTNPLKESGEYVAAIQQDIRWLGFDWHQLHFASAYFEQLYRFAEQLINDGKAYVDSLTAEQIREYRGTLTRPGRDSPHRDRTPEENLDLFRRMRAGEFADGEHVLRLKIDMASPNINLRDPTIYRIRHATHHQTGDTWCIYPMYDYTHCLSDALEGITHSLCDLSFEDHRPLYDWVIAQVGTNARPRQTEFSRLSLQYTVMSKRILRRIVEENLVNGWDDPRMPTLAGMRRRGYPPAAIRDFCRRIGVTKADNLVELAALENCVREALEPVAPRIMGVLDPLPVTLTNIPAEETEQLAAPNHPQNPALGSRDLPFTRTLYIDRADFRPQANRKYKRLVLGGEVRLRNAYVIRADRAETDADGNITHLHCTADTDTLGRNPQGRKVRGVIHWVSADRSLEAEVRLYQPLFTADQPEQRDADYRALVNPQSLRTIRARIEPSVADQPAGTCYQLEREGYFCIDPDSQPGALVLNQTVDLKSSFPAKETQPRE